MRFPKFQDLKPKFKRGFTLIEILVVISIIGVLAGITTFATSSAKGKGNDTRRKADLKAIETAVVAYYQDHKQYPPDPTAYNGTAYSSSAGGNWIPGLQNYINAMPKDPKQAGIITYLADAATSGIQKGQQLIAGIFAPPQSSSIQTPQQTHGEVAGTTSVNINANTTDGWNQYSNLSYPPDTTSGNTCVTTTGSTQLAVGQLNSGGVYYKRRAYLAFNTSSIPAGSTINSVTLTQYLATKSNVLTNFNMLALNYNWNNSLNCGQWGGSPPTATQVGTFATTSLPANGSTFTMTLSTSVVTVGGTTYVMLISDRDKNNNAPGSNEYLYLGSAEYAASPTYITVNYTTNSPPTNGTLVSGPSCVNYGTQYRFTTTTNDPDGYSDILYSYILINSTATYAPPSAAPAGAFEAVLNNASGDIGVADDTGTWHWSTDPSPNNSNSYASLNRATSTHSGSGTQLTTNWDITINSSWQTESASVWIRVTDSHGAATSWASVGTVNVPCPTDNASFVSQTGPPSTMNAGQVFNASITMQNTGNTTWTAASNYKLGTQNPQDNTTWTGSNRVLLTSSVSPLSQYTFNFPITAPSVAGTYNFQWQMVHDGVGWFGALSTNIVVNVVAAPTPTPSPTPGPTPTPAPSATASPTPIGGAAACPNTPFTYCYIVTTDRSSFVLWAELDSPNDPQAVGGSGSQCNLTPPAGSPFNYCIDASSL